MADFQQAVTIVLGHEGGYNGNVRDRGNYVSKQGNWAEGKYPNYYSPDKSGLVFIGTCKGITAPELYKYLGRLPTISEMKNLTENVAIAIYKKGYWGVIKGNEIIDQAVATIILDGAVNQGNGFMIRTLQTILKVDVDSIVGNQTLTALNNANQRVLYNSIKSARKTRYKQIAKQPGQSSFAEGWADRINSFKDYISNNKSISLTGIAAVVGVFFF